MSDSLEAPWTVARQAPQSVGFPRQEYCSGLWFPSPGDLPNPGIEPASPAMQADSLPLSHWGSPIELVPSLEQRCSYFKYSSIKKESEVTQSCLTVCDPMNCSTPGLPVHHRILAFTQTHVLWIGDAIQPFHPLLSPSPPAPASESFPMSQLFAWGGQSTGVSASASFPPKKPQGWSPSEWTGWISLQFKGLSRVFSNTTVQKHQFFGAELSTKPL